MYRCKNCDKPHHDTPDCGKMKKSNIDKVNESIYGSSNKRTIIMAVEKNSEDFNKLKNKWILDSGATSHMCNNIDILYNKKESISKLELALEKNTSNVLINGDIDVIIKNQKWRVKYS